MEDSNQESLIPQEVKDIPKEIKSNASGCCRNIQDKIQSFGFDLENFLFIVKPNQSNLDKECLFGISLKNGVRVFSVVILLEALSTLMDLFSPGGFWKFIWYLIVLCFFCIIAFYSFYSTIKEKKCCAKIAYTLISVVFLAEALWYIGKSLLKLLEFFLPWDDDFLRLRILVFIFGWGIYLFIYLYLIWILYCYMFTLSDDDERRIDEEQEKLV